MMAFVLVILCGLIAAALTTVLAGMTVHDVRSIKTRREIKRRPYARKWRGRPTVSVLIDGEPADECLKSIRKSNYRKLKIATDGSDATGEFILKVPSQAVLPRGAVKEAVLHSNGSPTLQSIELLPAIQRMPMTTRELFGHYYVMLYAPLASMHTGLNLTRIDSPYPLLVRRSASPRSRPLTALLLMFHVLNLMVFIYATYIVVSSLQPELLLIYLVGFTLWGVWSITRYPYASSNLKIIFLLLFPVSFIYFIYRLITAPLRFINLRPLPRNAIIK